MYLRHIDVEIINLNMFNNTFIAFNLLTVSHQSHFLASADEDGSVVVFDTHRTGPTAMVKGEFMLDIHRTGPTAMVKGEVMLDNT